MKLMNQWRRHRAYAADLREYRQVRDLPGLGRRAAQYVTGARLAWPGHGFAALPGVMEETREIAHHLAWLGRAGLPTLGSQPGQWINDPSRLCQGAQAYAQRAAVEFLAPPALADEIVRRATAVGLLASATLVEDMGRRPRRDDDRVHAVSVWTDHIGATDTPADVDALGPNEGVTWHVQTTFGGAGRGDLDFLTGALDDDGYDAVQASALVVVIDPAWGRRQHLWDYLTGAVMGARRSLAGAR